MTSPVVRRVALAEWREIRALRLRAVEDPDAAIAFLTSPAEEQARTDGFWQDRAAGAALSDDAAQFVAVDGERWIGAVTVLLRRPGDEDHLGRDVTAPRADIVGVYLEQPARGRGILGELLAAAGRFAAERGADALHLDVHVDNARAQAAYRKLGFEPTGETFTSSIGDELVMRMPLA
ncbi:GNAT family N-acetyltransferase [Microbacterium dauci]|uniref:GNAT family N-acetyltransferase n=1 Tax=Microbacterium dauci TaxID=3048008 RepID=A0ABT6ZC69_9MICO|nr:GNAT family N-acetyltransferase [Microbacterium sp. LX3-4]MDJ1113750.1 GNAT family N-acetyltransferase [Microbacterium sp. LX3-4]